MARVARVANEKGAEGGVTFAAVRRLFCGTREVLHVLVGHAVLARGVMDVHLMSNIVVRNSAVGAPVEKGAAQ